MSRENTKQDVPCVLNVLKPHQHWMKDRTYPGVTKDVPNVSLSPSSLGKGGQSEKLVTPGDTFGSGNVSPLKAVLPLASGPFGTHGTHGTPALAGPRPGGVSMTWLDTLLAQNPRSVFDSTLEALCSGLPTDDAQDLREERAAFFEYEAGFPRGEADLRAGLTPEHSISTRSTKK